MTWKLFLLEKKAGHKMVQNDQRMRFKKIKSTCKKRE